jgi:hypothetical protein
MIMEIKAKEYKAVEMLSLIARDVAPIKSSRIAAGLYIQGRLISIGVNQNKTSPFQKRWSRNDRCGALIHAEVDCLKNALKKVSVDDLKNATMVVTRMKYSSSERDKMVFGMVKPCSGCQAMLNCYSVARIIWTCDDGSVDGVEV